MLNRTSPRLFPLALGASLLLAYPLTAAAQPTTTMVSVSSEGYPGNSQSGNYERPDISGNGRYVAFSSKASNLVADDTNSYRDVFVHDRQTGETTRVSVGGNGESPIANQGNGDSQEPAITPDGRYVVFSSMASTLVTGDTNAVSDVFVHDRSLKMTTRVSVNSNGAQGGGNSGSPSISDDGRYVAFSSLSSNLATGVIDSNNHFDIFLHDRQTGDTSLVSKAHSGNFPGNGFCSQPVISGNGRSIAFYSQATNLVGNSDTNGTGDVFIRDLLAQTTSLVSATPGGSAGNVGSYAPALSFDGRYVAFSSKSDDLIAGDTSNTWDVFVRDRDTNQTTRVSFDSNGNTHSQSNFPSISADGRFLSYYNLNPDNQYDTYFTDRQTGKTVMVSVNNSGVRGDGDSSYNAISADGKYVAFESSASNLVNGDITGYRDIFVRGPMNEFPWTMFLPAITGGKK